MNGELAQRGAHRISAIRAAQRIPQLPDDRSIETLTLCSELTSSAMAYMERSSAASLRRSCGDAKHAEPGK